MGKLILVMPHTAVNAHPQLIPILERSHYVEVHLENRLSNTRLKELWHKEIDAMILYGPLLTSAQLTGLPSREFALFCINLPFSLPDKVAREPMCALLKAGTDGLELRMWGDGEKYAQLLCTVLTGLYSHLRVEVSNVRFTAKEKEVLRMLLQGLRDDYIARTMFISPKTVRNHISNMLRKVRVDSRTQLVLWAIQNQVNP